MILLLETQWSRDFIGLKWNQKDYQVANPSSTSEGDWSIEWMGLIGGRFGILVVMKMKKGEKGVGGVDV